MKKRRIAIIILSMMLLTGCGGQESQQQGTESGTGTSGMTEASSDNAEQDASQAAGQENPEQEPYVLEFEATTIDGEAVTSECFGQSRLTMLNIWATYCNPCLSEMPDLGVIAAAYDTADFQMYGIISDVMAEDEDSVIQEARDLIAQTQANYPHLLLNESLYMNLVSATSAVPTTFFVNQKGEVLGYVVGAQSKEAWEELIHDLLEQNP